MILHEANLKKAFETIGSYNVFYYFSTEEYLARQYGEKTVTLLMREMDAETTTVEGPVPSIEEIVAAAGTISMFGTKRIVEITQIEPASMTEADISALCDLMQSLENAVLVLTTVFKDDKAKTTKKAKQLIAAAEKTGLVAELLKPQMQDAKRFVSETAKDLNTELSPSAATALLDRCGTDFFLLENEIAKLAAASGYSEITPQLISAMGTKNIEADVFEMVRFVTAKQPARALSKLAQLIDLQNEPIAITAALAGAFIDMYRVKCGMAAKHNYAAVFKDFSYRGSDYRLKKSTESAAAYTKQQLAAIVEILLDLDRALKSSAANSVALLQTALCEIAAMGRRV